MSLAFSSLASIVRSTFVGRRELIHSGLSSLMLRLAGLASMFAMGVILARVLGPAEFGRYGLVTTVAAIGMSVGLLGTPQMAVREFSIRKARQDWAGIRRLGSSFALATSAASIGLAFFALAATFIWDDESGTALSLCAPGAIIMLFSSMTALIASELRGLGMMTKGQFMDVFARPFGAFLVLMALVTGGVSFGASEALWVQAGVASAAALVSLVWIRTAIPKQAKAPRSIPWLAIALPLGAVDVLRQLDGGYGVVLLGWLASDQSLGLFRVALACNVVIGMPATILHVLFAPKLAQLHDEGRRAEMQHLLSWTSAALVVILTIFSLAIALVGRPILEVVFGRIYGGSQLPLMMLSIAQLVFGVFGMGPILLAMCGGERHLIKIYLAGLGLGVGAALMLIPPFGAVGAAGATIVSMGTVGLLSWRYGRTHLRVDCTFVPLFRSRAS